MRSKAQCSPIGVDGRTNNLDSLVRVSIGWQIEEGNYFEQIGLCVDEANYGTIWTNHTLHGQNIAHRDKHPDRPGFKVDTTRSKRWADESHFFTLYFLSGSSLGQAQAK